MNKEITRLTGITEDQWAQMVFDAGIALLQSRMKSEQWVSAISQTEAFWTWFKNQWMQIDESFVNTWSIFEVSARSQAKLAVEYVVRHEVEKMVAYPSKMVLAEAIPAYAKMIGVAIKEVVR